MDFALAAGHGCFGNRYFAEAGSIFIRFCHIIGGQDDDINPRRLRAARGQIGLGGGGPRANRC